MARWSGELDATLAEPGGLFAGLRSENGETETQRLAFHGGWTWLGPLRIAAGAAALLSRAGMRRPTARV